ncbi:MAG: SCP2 sterol-binding domain-containing protein [Anaerolineae bacterium]|jgi:putative sterol carrier protein
MSDKGIKDLLTQIANVDPAQIEGISGVFLFDLSGEGGGKWMLAIDDGKANLQKVAKEQGVDPDVTLSMAAEDLIAISNGSLNPVAAFMQGKVRVSGDMGLAMRMQSLLT